MTTSKAIRDTIEKETLDAMEWAVVQGGKKLTTREYNLVYQISQGVALRSMQKLGFTKGADNHDNMLNDKRASVAMTEHARYVKKTGHC